MSSHLTGITPCTCARANGVSVAPAAVEYLTQHPCQERRNGRPRKPLPPDIARLILLDIDAGRSDSVIVAHYSRLVPFSRSWLRDVKADGRLVAMAESTA